MTLRILIADDDRDTAATLQMILEDEGHVVHAVHDGADVVLIDIGMPKLSGYDVARHIRERYGKDRPVLVALTGWKQASDRILATLAGFDHHVAKPYDPGRLLELVRSVTPGK